MLQGNGVTGIYSIAVKIYTIIKQFINAVVGVALPRLSYYLGQNDKGKYNALLTKLMHSLMLLIFPSIVGIIMVGKKIIILIAGKEFEDGYLALCILSVAIIFAVLSFLYVYGIMIPYGNERKCLISTVIAATTNVVLNFLFIPAMSLNGAAITTVISEILVLATSMYFSRGLYKIGVIWKMFLPCGVGCVSVFIVCLIINSLKLPTITSLAIAVICSSIVYVAILVLLKDEITQDIVRSFLRRK